MARFYGGGGANADDIISQITDSAPETLNTLNELAAALNDDANFATTVVSSLAQKVDATTPEFNMIASQEILIHNGTVYQPSLFNEYSGVVALLNYTGPIPSQGDVYYIDHPIMTGVPLVDIGSTTVFSPEIYIQLSLQEVSNTEHQTALASYAANGSPSSFRLLSIQSITLTADDLANLSGITSNVQNQLDSKLESSDLSGYVTKNQTVSGLAGNRTLSQEYDSGKAINCIGSSPITITVPANEFDDGARVDIINSTSSTVTFVAGPGMIIRSEDGLLTMDTQYTIASILFTSSSECVLLGKLA